MTKQELLELIELYGRDCTAMAHGECDEDVGSDELAAMAEAIESDLEEIEAGLEALRVTTIERVEARIDKINDCTIVACTHFCQLGEGLLDARIILGVKPDGEYVTAYHTRGASIWGWGHYFEALDKAFADYAERACTLLGRETGVRDD